MESQHKKESKDSFLTGLIIAGFFWVIYTLYIDDFIATDLRLASSIISEKLLNLIGVTIHRNGTVLYNDSMSFEVIGACSGSTTLKIMLGVGILLSLSWRGLNKSLRIAAIIISGMLAILFNGIRVCILVLGGIALGTPIKEGAMHDTIGLVTFAICFCTFCLTCLKLAKRQNTNYTHQNHSAKNTIQILSIIIVLFLLYLPFLKDLINSWIGSSWDSSNKRGFIYFILPILIAVYQSYYYVKKFKLTTDNIWTEKSGIALITISLVLGIFSKLINVNIIGGFSIITMITALILVYTDLRNTITLLPILLLTILGFPRIILRIENILPDNSELNPETVRELIFISILAIQILTKYLYKKNYIYKKPIHAQNTTDKQTKITKVKKYLLYSSITTLTITLLIPVNIVHENNSAITIENINAPYFLNGWSGKDLEILENDSIYFGKNNIIYREYSKIDNKTQAPIELLITLSGGDRHKNHPPEFCQTGSGWQISSKKLINSSTNSLRSLTMLHLKSGNKDKYMLYFFSSENSEESNYSKMMFSDITSRLTGNITNWAVIRLFSSSKKSLLEFVKELPYPLFNLENKVYSSIK